MSSSFKPKAERALGTMSKAADRHKDEFQRAAREGRTIGATRPKRLGVPPWGRKQDERQGELRLRTQLTAVLAHAACLVIGALLVAIGLANALTLLPHGTVTACFYLASGIALLRWVAGGKGSPTATAK